MAFGTQRCQTEPEKGLQPRARKGGARTHQYVLGNILDIVLKGTPVVYPLTVINFPLRDILRLSLRRAHLVPPVEDHSGEKEVLTLGRC